MCKYLYVSAVKLLPFLIHQNKIDLQIIVRVCFCKHQCKVNKFTRKILKFLLQKYYQNVDSKL